MGNVRSHESSQGVREKTEAMQTVREELEKEMSEIQNLYQSARVRCCVMMKKREIFIKFAAENCKNEAVVQWMTENSESEDFSKLVDMFDFLKKHIDEEEKKNHSNDVHITFVSHGEIRDSMIPASCLLPQSTIRDVVLYSPWNCRIYSDAAYGVATGLMKPQHRVFFCETKKKCQIPDEKHQPRKLPNHWNSLKKAGDKMIPKITLSPLKPPEDKYWKKFEVLTKTHGPPGRNRIIIPFILPGEGSESVPFSVITLALSLVLLSSRFTATVHLAACLGDRSAGQKFDRNYLQQQYAYTVDDTGLTVSDDMLRVSSTLKSG